MSETSQQPATGAPAAPAVPAGHEGPVQRAEHTALGWFGRHASGAEHVASAARTALEHAASVLPVAAKVIAAAKLVDPADAELLTAFGELLPEALTMVGKAVDDALAEIKAA